MNLMSRWGQYRFKASDYLNFLKKYVDVDYVIINDKKPPQEIINIYKKDNEFEIKDDLIDNIELRMNQEITEKELFTVRWVLRG